MKAITFRGKTQSLPAWSRELGIPENTLRSRLTKLRLSVEEAFTRPSDPRFRPTPKPSGPPPISPAPLLEQRPDGRAFCRWSEGRGRRYRYFGKYGTAEANAAYARFAAEWFANQGRPAPPAGEVIGVAGLILRYLDHAEVTYRKNGKITFMVHGIRAAMRVVARLYGGIPATAFGPEQLRAVQAAMVQQGLSLKTVNAYCNRVCRCFSWGVSRGLVPAAVADALPHVPTLVPGRSEAVVYDPIPAGTAAGAAAVAVMYNHYHIVVQVDDDPDPRKVLADFKAYGTRVLSARFGQPPSGTWWTGKGSKRKLTDDDAAVSDAIFYVLKK